MKYIPLLLLPFLFFTLSTYAKTIDVVTVTRVIDGDTIEVNLNGESKRVRLIGIDTPELNDSRPQIRCFAELAKTKMQYAVEGKDIIIVSDNSQSDRDRYNRLLRFVYLDKNTNLNYLMVWKGYAYEYTYSSPYRKQDKFKEAQKVAEKRNRGLWGDKYCNNITNTPIPPTNTPVPPPTWTPAPLPTQPPVQQVQEPVQQAPAYGCNCSKTCGSMSCEEAYYQLNQCGCGARDRDDDGVPCESICPGG